MNATVKNSLRFLFSGLTFALLFLVVDIYEGKSFEFLKFLMRMAIFGSLMTISFIIIDMIHKSRKAKNH